MTTTNLMVLAIFLLHTWKFVYNKFNWEIDENSDLPDFIHVFAQYDWVSLSERDYLVAASVISQVWQSPWCSLNLCSCVIILKDRT